jgi:putative colanic acid biosynthesis glycosyltransferase
MIIFQLNVRLAEGGAAGVALDLHRRSIAKGISSTFIYGYGKKGLKSKSHKLYKNTIKNTNVFISYLNLLTFPLLNYDPFGNLETLVKEVNKYNADEKIIIHLHVIHSYWLNYHRLVDVFSKLKASKNISLIWTLHDHWAITGRCAFLDKCENWTKKCIKCPTIKNYPPVRIDKAKKEFLNKVNFIKKMNELGCNFISPSFHVADAFNNQYEKLGINTCRVINNGIDIDSEKFIKNVFGKYVHEPHKIIDSEKRKFAVVAHDLSYDGKTNISLIKSILKNDIELHTFGKNSMFNGANVINHGFISSKPLLLQAINDLDGLIFTSKVDNYPLILCECLSLGIPVLATESEASIEVLGKVGGTIIGERELVKYTNLSKGEICQILYGKTSEELRHDALKAYSGNRMLAEYTGVYENI